jgi:hypothetical protein
VTDVRALKNVGRETHTMLHYLLAHWGALPETMLFLPGNAGVHPWRQVRRAGAAGKAPGQSGQGRGRPEVRVQRGAGFRRARSGS